MAVFGGKSEFQFHSVMAAFHVSFSVEIWKKDSGSIVICEEGFFSYYIGLM